MSKISVDLSKAGVKLEGEASEIMAFLNKTEVKIQNSTPKALAGLGVLISATDKALSDVSAGAANPVTLAVAIPGDIADFKAAWSALKTFVADLGVSV
jgi:hypothetical protein